MKRRLGELLLERHAIDAAVLEAALREQAGRASRLGEILLDRHWVGKGALIEALSEITRVPYLDATSITPDRKALARLSREAALQYWAFPVGLERGALVTIMVQPQDLHVIYTLQFLCGQRISPRLGFRDEILKAIDTNYPATETNVALESVAELEAASTSEPAQARVWEFRRRMIA